MTALLSPDRTKESAVSYFFFSGLRPRFSRQAASPLAWLGFACSNFAKKRDCSQSSKKCFRGVTIPDIGTRDNGEPSCDISFVYTAKTTRSDGCSIVLKVTKSLKYLIHLMNDYVMLLRFALRPSIVYCTDSHNRK